MTALEFICIAGFALGVLNLGWTIFISLRGEEH